MKKSSKKSPSKKTKEAYHLLMYCVDCSPMIKKFSTTEKMSKFIDDFQKQFPDYMSIDSGNWIDYCVLGVTGEVHFFTDGLKVK